MEIARESLNTLLAGERLGEERALAVMDAVMDGNVPTSQLAGILIALRLLGEGEEEIAGLARAMRRRVERELQPYRTKGFDVLQDRVIDTCGTGGDCAGTFNISTAAALIVAAAGVPVAKHGNRAVSGKAGSADVLEALGIAVDVSPALSFRCLTETGFGFFFAPRCHRAMAHAAPARRELGVPTVFNLLGPLTNPAGARRQLLGINRNARVGLMARVLARLGVQHAWVVHGLDGLDEISLTGPTEVARLKNGVVEETIIDPHDFGFSYCRPEDLQGGDKEHNAAIVQSVLRGVPGPAHDIVVLNAAAALCVAERVNDLSEGIRLAQAMITGGAASRLLARLQRLTNEQTLENQAVG